MAWLVVALVVVGLIAARYARAFGLLGILGSMLVAVVVVLAILRAVGPTLGHPLASALASARSPQHNAAERPTSSSSSSTIGPRPSTSPVVVIEPTEAAPETLEAKLATLDRLRDDGRLTDAEYEAKRAQLIADF